MRLLISANSFDPAVGGYERVAKAIAVQLAARGHSVRIITFTPAPSEQKLPFEVYRNPTASTLLALFKWSDVYIQNNVSLKLLWPILFHWRPLVCVHHGFYRAPTDSLFSWKYRLKHLMTYFSKNISVSKGVANAIPGASVVAANPYQDDLFYRIPQIAKERDLFFVGRMVSDKGIDILIDAMGELRDRGVRPSLTLAGAGPEQDALRERVKRLDLEHLVHFAGRVSDSELNELMNAHKIMVVPTRHGEGFGVVALEGIACGCVIVGSDGGGLPEAIGPCGMTFPDASPTALADLLFDLLKNPAKLQGFRAHAREHLEAHRPSTVAQKYLDVILPLVETRDALVNRSNG